MCGKKLNPFNWTRSTILLVLFAILALAIPSYLFGLSAFATTINPVNATLKIPAIKLSASVSPAIFDNNTFLTPDHHVASFTNNNKVFLFAHSTTAFKNLSALSIGDEITYIANDRPITVRVYQAETLTTAEISMHEVIADSKYPELILMTCAGEKTANGSYPERLLIYAR